ncbi:hypothetical protein ZOSMA_196G00360 [Zostera marina]|uniref:Uncharacterized protein n=2 Tax=Zostera marina TaxID=29655 RepID=A0A0K9PR53_ZOSMR|nr:hypothetical protein ZOSMA_196G00360 [Zostera marina]
MPIEMAAASEMNVAVLGPVAVGACIGLAIFYVAILYSPSFLLRLPPPDSFHVFMIRQFVCTIVSTVLSLFASFLLLGVRSFKDMPSTLRIYGIRSDHMLQAVGLPILLKFLPYAVSLVSKKLSMTYVWRETSQFEEHNIPFHRGLLMRIYMFGTNILALRAYVVVSFYYSYNHSTPISNLLGCLSPTLRC